MARRSYLHRIAGPVEKSGDGVVLAPPRLLFRPSAHPARIEIAAEALTLATPRASARAPLSEGHHPILGSTSLDDHSVHSSSNMAWRWAASSLRMPKQSGRDRLAEDDQLAINTAEARGSATARRPPSPAFVESKQDARDARGVEALADDSRPRLAPRKGGKPESITPEPKPKASRPVAKAARADAPLIPTSHEERQYMERVAPAKTKTSADVLPASDSGRTPSLGSRTAAPRHRAPAEQISTPTTGLTRPVPTATLEFASSRALPAPLRGVHIGSLEVRIVNPPTPPAPAPRLEPANVGKRIAPAPLSHCFRVFGLAQA
jgi:hypothetical protein